RKVPFIHVFVEEFREKVQFLKNNTSEGSWQQKFVEEFRKKKHTCFQQNFKELRKGMIKGKLTLDIKNMFVWEHKWIRVNLPFVECATSKIPDEICLLNIPSLIIARNGSTLNMFFID
ncbi:hypothetical protein ACJX0J_025550, partial [Zea mays]